MKRQVGGWRFDKNSVRTITKCARGVGLEIYISPGGSINQRMLLTVLSHKGRLFYSFINIIIVYI